MTVIIRMQNLSLEASAQDIRHFFYGLQIPDGGVHIVGGKYGDVFIAFASDEDARRAMMCDHDSIRGQIIRLFLSSHAEMDEVIAIAKEHNKAMMSVPMNEMRSVSPKRQQIHRPVYSPSPPRITKSPEYSSEHHLQTEKLTFPPSFRQSTRYSPQREYSPHLKSSRHAISVNISEPSHNVSRDSGLSPRSINRQERSSDPNYLYPPEHISRTIQLDQKQHYVKKSTMEEQVPRHRIIANETDQKATLEKIVDDRMYSPRTKNYDSPRHGSGQKTKDIKTASPHSQEPADIVEHHSGQKVRSRISRKLERSISPPPKRARRSVSVDSTNICLYIGNLPANVAFHDCHSFFSNHGEKEVKLINDLRGERIGCGYIKFSNANKCENAYQEMNGKIIAGKKVHLAKCSMNEYSDAFDSYRPNVHRNDRKCIETLRVVRRYGDYPPDATDHYPSKRATMHKKNKPKIKNFTCIKVSNMPARCSRFDLIDFFAGLHLEKNDVYVEYDNNGIVVGNAYVKFSTYQDADTAETFSNKSFNSKDKNSEVKKLKITRVSWKVMLTAIEKHQARLQAKLSKDEWKSLAGSSDQKSDGSLSDSGDEKDLRGDAKKEFLCLENLTSNSTIYTLTSELANTPRISKGIHVMESDSKKSKRQAVVQFHNHDGAVLGKKQLQKKQHDTKFTYLSYDEAVKWLASKNHYQHPRGQTHVNCRLTRPSMKYVPKEVVHKSAMVSNVPLDIGVTDVFPLLMGYNYSKSDVWFLMDKFACPTRELFVTFVTRDEAKRAVKDLDGYKLKDKTLKWKMM